MPPKEFEAFIGTSATGVWFLLPTPPLNQMSGTDPSDLECFIQKLSGKSAKVEPLLHCLNLLAAASALLFMKPNCFKFFCILFFSFSAAGCAWFFSADPALAEVKLVSVPPDAAQCHFIAQAIGVGETGLSHDPGDLAEQREEAETNVKRIALQRGGNIVHIVEAHTENVYGFINDNTETRLICHVYNCP